MSNIEFVYDRYNPNYPPKLEITDATIMYPNFSGAERKWNAAGKRNFILVITDADIANRLSDEGWNIRMVPPKNEGDEPFYKLPVEVSFKSFGTHIRPPKISIISNGVRTMLDEQTVSVLDNVEIDRVAVVIRPRLLEEPTPAGNTIKAYLSELKAVLAKSRLEDVYAEYENPSEAPWDE